MFLLPEAKANHILGGDITYTNIGPNQYKFTLTVYRDCSGNLLDIAYSLNYKSSTCGVASSSFIVNKVGAAEEVSILCPSKLSTCNGGGEIGIQKQLYTGIVTLPKSCNDWIISWDPGANSKRNSAITNIADPVNQNFYIEAKINNSKINNNNSPSFSGMAFSYLITGQKGVINTTATDIDGNDLKYLITTPKTSASTTVKYNTGFTATSPISSGTAASFNNSTGELSLSPTAIEKSVTAIVVEEYKDGEFIGSVTRDLQIITLSYANKIPTLSGINNTNLDSLRICAGDKVNFKIYGTDEDLPAQKLTVTWNNGITLVPGNGFDGLVTTTGQGNDTTTFKWKSPVAANGLYTFTVTLKDDYCPIVGTTSRTFKIRVFPKPIFNLANDTTINCTDQKLLLPFNIKGKSPYQYLWSTGATTNNITADPGNFKLTITDANSCTYSDSINIKSGLVALFSFDSLCAGSPTHFKDLSFSKSGSNITKWNWDFNDPSTGLLNTSIAQNPTHQFTDEGNFNVKLKIEDEFGCKGDTSFNLHLCSKPLPNFEILDTCKRNPAVMKDLTVTKGCGIIKYEMTFVQLATKKVEKVNYTYPKIPPFIPGQSPANPLSNWLPADSGTYQVTMVAINENGCRNAIQKNVYIRPQPIVSLKEKDFAFRCNRPDTILHVLDTMTVKSKLPSNKTIWEPLKLSWEGRELYKTDSLQIHVNGGGNYSVKVTDMFGCDSIESVNILKAIDASIGNKPYCKAGQVVKFIDYSSSNLDITSRSWDFGDGNTTSTSGKDTSVLNVSHLYASDGIYKTIISIESEGGCTDTDTIDVLVNTIEKTFSANPTPVCLFAPISLTSRTGAYIDTIYWTFGDGSTSKISKNNMTTSNGKSVYHGTHSYSKYGTGKYDIIALTYYNKNLCYVRDTAKITMFLELKIALDPPTGLCAFLPTDLNVKATGKAVTNWRWDIFYQNGTPPYETNQLDSIKVLVVDENGKSKNKQTKTFTKGGNYYASIKATNVDGCEAKVDRQLFRILDLPPPTYCIPDSCVETPLLFSLFCGNKPEVSMNKFLWDFGDGNTSSSADSVYHTYKKVGNFPVTVTISDTNYQCSRTATDTIHLKSVAFPAFIADNVCYKEGTNFVDKSQTVPGDDIVKWYWRFGEGSTSEMQSPTHIYANTGTYHVTLSVTNKGKNCSQDFDTTVTVYPKPKAGFFFDEYNATAQIPVLFNNSASTDVTKWLYDFGDGSMSSKESPDHRFEKPNIYLVKQEVTNQFGCKDEITKPIDLNIYMIFPTGFSPNGDDKNNTFHPILRGVQKIDEIKLYNRWGELIWETSGEINEKWDWKDHSWDGKYQGVDQPMGVYVYYARAKSFLGDDIKVEGKVTIIR